MAKASEILGINRYNRIILDGQAQNKSDDEIKSLIQAEAKAQLQNNTTQKANKTVNENTFKGSIYANDGIKGDIARGVTTSGVRLMNLADGVANSIGFDIVPDKYQKPMTEAVEHFEANKEKRSQKGLAPERLAEIEQLQKESSEAEGLTENIVSGVKSMWDVATHPSEWTAQGVIAGLTDPLNAVSFGAGGIASKFARSMVGKVGMGATGGAIEGASVNALGEYAIAKGSGKSDAEANKIAQQSIGGGAMAGAGFGAVGGATAGLIGGKTNIPEDAPDLSEKSISDILQGDSFGEFMSPEDIKNSMENGIGSYPEIPDKYKREKIETAPREPNFRMVMDNLPAVVDENGNVVEPRDPRYPQMSEEFAKEQVIPYENIHPEQRAKQDFIMGSTENLPAFFDNLVEVEVIDEPELKQIAYNHVQRIEHLTKAETFNKILETEPDVIYAEMSAINQSLKQEIKDAMVGREIHKQKRVEEIARSFIGEQKLLTNQMVEAGASVSEIKDTINNKFWVTPEEQAITFFLNDGLPVENRYAGLRLVELTKNTIETSKEIPVEPKVLKQKLQSGGVSDQLSNKVVESVINKNVEILEDHVADKLSEQSKQAVEQVEKQVDEVITITEENLAQWLKDNPVQKSNDPEILYRNAVDELATLQKGNGDELQKQRVYKAIEKELGKDYTEYMKLQNEMNKQRAYIDRNGKNNATGRSYDTNVKTLSRLRDKVSPKELQDFLTNNKDKFIDKSYASKLQKAKAKVDKYAKQLGLDKEPEQTQTKVEPTNEPKVDGDIKELEQIQSLDWKNSSDIQALTDYKNTLEPGSKEDIALREHIGYVQRNGMTPGEKTKKMEAEYQERMSKIDPEKDKESIQALNNQLRITIDELRKKGHSDPKIAQMDQFKEIKAQIEKIKDKYKDKIGTTYEKDGYKVEVDGVEVFDNSGVMYTLKAFKNGKEIEFNQLTNRDGVDKLDGVVQQLIAKESWDKAREEADLNAKAEETKEAKAKEDIEKRYQEILDADIIDSDKVNNNTPLQKTNLLKRIDKHGIVDKEITEKYVGDGMYKWDKRKYNRMNEKEQIAYEERLKNEKIYNIKYLEDGKEFVHEVPKSVYDVIVLDKGTKIEPEAKKNQVKPNQHKGVSLVDLTDEQRAERKAYRELEKDIEFKINQRDWVLDGDHLVRTTHKGQQEKLSGVALDIAKDQWAKKQEQMDHKNRWQNHEALSGLDKDITYDEGYNAHRGTSFTPEQRAKTEVANHIETLTDDYETLLQKVGEDTAKKEILDSEFERYRAGLVKRKKDLLAKRSRIVSTMIAGGGNFPVARMNKLNGYVDNAFEEYVNYRDKALNTIARKIRGDEDTGVIRSDDPEAITKLKKKIAGLEKNQHMMKEANRIVRSKKFSKETMIEQLKTLGFKDDKAIASIFEPFGTNGKLGFPSYSLQNNNANIRTAKQRLVKLEREHKEAMALKEAGEEKATEYVGAKIVENLEAKRVQILFDEIPDADVRTQLKKRGFKWSPRNKAWQRGLNPTSDLYAKNVLDQFYKKVESEEPKGMFDGTELKEKVEADMEAKFNEAIKRSEEC
jgi:hypothetical protein